MFSYIIVYGPFASCCYKADSVPFFCKIGCLYFSYFRVLVWNFVHCYVGKILRGADSYGVIGYFPFSTLMSLFFGWSYRLARERYGVVFVVVGYWFGNNGFFTGSGGYECVIFYSSIFGAVEN